MAYLREENEKLEVSYPLNQVWQAMPNAIEKLEWKIEESNQETHYLKVKTKGAFLSYPSTFKIELTALSDKTTKMSISAQTPTTTITSMADIGRTRERIDQFIVALAKLMGG